MKPVDFNARQIAEEICKNNKHSFTSATDYDNYVTETVEKIRKYAERKCFEQRRICAYKLKDDPDYVEDPKTFDRLIKMPAPYMD